MQKNKKEEKDLENVISNAKCPSLARAYIKDSNEVREASKSKTTNV